MMRATRFVYLAVIQTLLLAFWSADLSAQYTTLAGGSGGKSYTLRCNEGDVLVGLEASHGAWIDKIRIYCANTHRTGSWSVVDLEPNTWVGGMWGKSRTKIQCDPGQAIKAFSGKAGWYVNSIVAACHKLDWGARTTGSATSKSINSTTSGGTTYGPGSPYTCGESMPAIGIRGRADMYVDAFGLICGYILPATPTTAQPVKGSDVTTRRPEFRFTPGTRAESHQVCINLSSNAACSISGTVASPLIYSDTETRWVPPSDLPFQRGDLVYWKIEACNRNGCKRSISNFRFMPAQTSVITR